MRSDERGARDGFAKKPPLSQLGDVATNFDSRRIPLSKKQRCERPGSYPYYGATGVLDYVDRPIFEGRHLLMGEDGSVVTNEGKPVLQLVDGEFWVSNHAHVLRGADDTDTIYLFYALKTVDISGWVTGAVQPKLNQRNMNDIPVPWWSRPVRSGLVKVLRSFDEKIALNSQLAQTYESIAQTLFKSWFIDFDPVKAKMDGRDPAGMDAESAALFPDQMVESDLEKIPEGWDAPSLGQCVTIHDSKRVPLSKKERARKQGSIPYYGATSVMDYVDGFIFDDEMVLMGEDGSVVHNDGTPYLQYIWGKSWVNNHAHVMKGAGCCSTGMVYTGLNFVDVSPYVTGAVQLKISQKNLKQIPFHAFSPESAARYSALIAPLFERIRLLEEESRVLENARDLLLPKLISGELELPGTEEQVEAATA